MRNSRTSMLYFTSSKPIALRTKTCSTGYSPLLNNQYRESIKNNEVETFFRINFGYIYKVCVDNAQNQTLTLKFILHDRKSYLKARIANKESIYRFTVENFYQTDFNDDKELVTCMCRRNLKMYMKKK